MTGRHVVMLTNAIAPDKLGGLERYVRELAGGLVTRGVRVTLLTKRVDPEHPRHEYGSDGVEIVRHQTPSKRNPAFALLYPYRIASGVKRSMDVDGDAIVHAHFPVPAIWPAMRGADYAYTFHNPVYKEILEERHDSYLLPKAVQRPAVAALKKAEAAVLKRADTVIALSEFSRTELELLDAEVAEQARVIPGGVNTDWFSPQQRQERPPALLFTARRLTPRTGVLELIRAMATIVTAVPGVQLFVAGDGGSRDVIEAEIDRLEMRSHVCLLGRLGDNDLRSWYRRATLSIVPSQAREGFGLSTAESLATGTPALVTPVGANAEIVGRIDPALVAEGTTPDAIAAAVTNLLTAPGLIDRVRARCRDRVDPDYSWSTVLDKHLEIYERLWRRADDR